MGVDYEAFVFYGFPINTEEWKEEDHQNYPVQELEHPGVTVYTTGSYWGDGTDIKHHLSIPKSHLGGDIHSDVAEAVPLGNLADEKTIDLWNWTLHEAAEQLGLTFLPPDWYFGVLIS